MSLETFISADLNAGAKASAADLSYLAQRAKNTCYDFVMRKFLASGLTKAELGRRIGKTQPQINHMLATPANWTIKTLAELLAGISKEEFMPSAAPLEGRAPRNVTQADLLKRRRAREQWSHSSPVIWDQESRKPERIRMFGNGDWKIVNETELEDA